uniref:Uncharacterized protein n=1 Tax=Panagrolaimus superbus TaxID=310955 RepID=A0A914Y8Q3_9BILA
MSFLLNHCAIEAKEIEQKCNEYMEEIMRSPEEYTRKNIDELQQSIKDDLLKLLKKCDVRPTKIAEYQYGFSTKLVENTRLIVIEKGDRTKCREYSAYRLYDQFCLQCRSLSNHKLLLYSRLIHGILFVPINHICDPKEYAAVMEVQEKMKEGDLKTALSLQRKYAVKKHPRFLNASEKPAKCSKAATSKKEKAVQKEGDSVAAAASQDVENKASAEDDGNLLNTSPQSSLSKEVEASTSQYPGAVKDTANNNEANANQEATTSASTLESQNIVSPNNPSQILSASSLIEGNRGGGSGKGRKRGSKNLLCAKNSLDLIDAIKSLLPPENIIAENSAPKKRRRRRKVSIQAAAAFETLKGDDDENVDLTGTSTNAIASILDMIDTELLNSEKYPSEHSATSDTEDTDDCEIVEEKMFLSIQNE